MGRNAIKRFAVINHVVKENSSYSQWYGDDKALSP